MQFRTSRFIVWIVIIFLGHSLSGCAHHDLLDRYLEQPEREGPTCYVGEVIIDSSAGIKTQPATEDSDYFRRYLGASLVDQNIFGRAGFDDPTGFRYSINSIVTDYHMRSGFFHLLFRGITGFSSMAVRIELVDRRTGETIYTKAFQAIETQKDDTPREIMECLAVEIADDLAINDLLLQ